MLPDTVQQLTILLVLVLPGVFYQAVRERLRGALPAEQDPQNRIVRAIAVGVILDGLYAVIAGPWLVHVIAGGPGQSVLGGITSQPRAAGLAALLLIVAVPSLVAWAEATVGARRLRARYEPLPAGWDALFQDLGSCFVRMRLRSGLWVGGWWGRGSHASGYPQEADIYLERQATMRPDGSFSGWVARSGGVYVRGADVEVLEILKRPAPPARLPEGDDGATPTEAE